MPQAFSSGPVEYVHVFKGLPLHTANAETVKVLSLRYSTVVPKIITQGRMFASILKVIPIGLNHRKSMAIVEANTELLYFSSVKMPVWRIAVAMRKKQLIHTGIVFRTPELQSELAGEVSVPIGPDTGHVP